MNLILINTIIKFIFGCVKRDVSVLYTLVCLVSLKLSSLFLVQARLMWSVIKDVVFSLRKQEEQLGYWFQLT